MEQSQAVTYFIAFKNFLRIELGSVANSGLVSLTPADFGWTLGYEDVPNLGNILLSGLASADASGSGGGDIQIQGKRVTLTDGSAIFALTFGSEPGGAVTVNASESVEVIGTRADGQFPSAVFTETQGAGVGGNLTITTLGLLVQDGGVIVADTVGAGNAGKLNVNASDFVQLIGISADGNFASQLYTNTNNDGAAGNLTINTRQLQVLDGASISASTSGRGQAGTLTVNASDSVKLIGATEDGYGSNLSAETRGSGAGGNLTINTRQLLVQDGAYVSAANYSTGNAGTLAVKASDLVQLIGESADGSFASGLFTSVQPGATGAGGNLTLETRQLSVRDGAQIAASTLGEGSAGSLAVTASESVELKGTSADAQRPSLTVRTTGSGKAGDLTIATGELTIRDGAAVTASSTSTASDAKGSGSIDITAQTIRLDNRGAIAAETSSGNGGNITLRSPNLLSLGNNSRISTTAGTVGFGGNGGNIDIDTNFIIAIPGGNSDIKANAYLGQGGNVTINAKSIFGLAVRNLTDLQALLETNDPTKLDPINLPSNDITAISQTDPSFSGQVNITTLDLDPTQGLVTLPGEVVDLTGLIAQACLSGGEVADNNKFTITGRGGLPPNPREPLGGEAVLTNWATLRGSREQGQRSRGAEEQRSRGAIQQEMSSSPLPPIPSASLPHLPISPTPHLPHSPSSTIVEATGWVTNDKGEVVLTASTPTTTLDIPWVPSTGCHASKP